jgi:hypothetical protein
MFNSYNFNLWPKIKWGVIVLAIIVTIIIVFASCTSTKHIETSSVLTEEKKIIDSSSYWKLKLSNLKLLSEEHQKELKSQLEFQESNGEQLVEAFENVQDLFIEKGLLSDSLNTRLKVIFDSLKNFPCKSKLIYRADGSIEATGLKYANFQLDESNRKIEILKQEKDEEINKRVHSEELLKIEIANKKMDKKTKVLSWIMFLVVGYILGIFFPPMKILHGAKLLFTKK